ncbi:MAG: hypothetical protein KDD62_04675 [Bdellovibrionales bacterium]|nr:hypothetical protein [Bdellovibrionales bacterium]
MARVAALLLIFFGCQILHAEKLARFPHDLNTRLSKQALSFVVSTKRLGKLRFQIWKNRILKHTDSEDFRGVVERGAESFPVAASVIGDRLELQFFARRNRTGNKRPTTIYLPIEGSDSAYLTQVSSRIVAGCGAQSYQLMSATRTMRALPLSPLRYLEISTDADLQYYKEYRNKTLRRIQGILNAVDVLYMNQLGIKLSVVNQNVFTTSDNPYKSSSSFSLLNTFKAHTLSQGHLGVADTFHLFTGKKLRQSIIGLAFVGKICKAASDSFGLTQRVNNSIQSLVTAHELGHLLGATHPEDTLNAPDASLMTGIVRAANSSFSDFSLAQINNNLAADSSCLSVEPGKMNDLVVSFDATEKLLGFSYHLAGYETLTNCMFEVQAASKYSKLLRFNGSVLASGPMTNAYQLVNVAWPEAGSRKTKAFFRVVAQCDGGEIVSSSIVKQKVSAKNRKILNSYLRSLS